MAEIQSEETFGTFLAELFWVPRKGFFWDLVFDLFTHRIRDSYDRIWNAELDLALDPEMKAAK